MALLKVHFFGDSLRKMCNMTVILPEHPPKGKLPVLYLLHGLSDDDSAWTRRSNLERYASALPLVVVMPDGGRSFYSDAHDGPPYEAHIMKDVLGFVERSFPVGRTRAHRAISGLSMGGYGAMKLAMKHPKVFASVYSHSSAFDFAHRSFLDRPEFIREFQHFIGPKLQGGPNDLFSLASRLDRKLAPAIAFDCGTDDPLLASNRNFHKHLLKLRIPHLYKEYPGAHNWDYWDLHVRQALEFHAKHLAIPR